MMSRFLHCVASMLATTGIPKDNKQFSFAVMDPGVAQEPQVEADAIAAALTTAFDLAGPSGADLSSYISPSVSHSTNASSLKIYDVSAHLDGSPHGSPIATAHWTLESAASNAGLPDQCCACVTLRAVGWETAPVEEPDGDDVGGAVDRPKQRHTGRMFIGPLNIDAMSAPIANVPRLKPDFRTTVNQAVDELNNQLQAEGLELMVWSRALSAMGDAVAVQCDDRFDTQRRRLPAPLVRETVDLTN